MLRRLLVLTIAALLALALAGPPAMLRPAQAAGPGMSLAAPASVAVGETFTVSIVADPAPDVEIAGFGAAVLFPVGKPRLMAKGTPVAASGVPDYSEDVGTAAPTRSGPLQFERPGLIIPAHGDKFGG